MGKDEEKYFKHDAMREMYFYKQRLQNGADPASCPRGLEKHTRQRRMHKKRTIDLVLLAQKRGLNPEVLAQISQHGSNWNRAIAKTQGSIDHVAVLIDSNRDEKEQ